MTPMTRAQRESNAAKLQAKSPTAELHNVDQVRDLVPEFAQLVPDGHVHQAAQDCGLQVQASARTELANKVAQESADEATRREKAEKAAAAEDPR